MLHVFVVVIFFVSSECRIGEETLNVNLYTSHEFRRVSFETHFVSAFNQLPLMQRSLTLRFTHLKDTAFIPFALDFCDIRIFNVRVYGEFAKFSL